MDKKCNGCKTNMIESTTIITKGLHIYSKYNPSLKTEGRLILIFGVHCVYRTFLPIVMKPGEKNIWNSCLTTIPNSFLMYYTISCFNVSLSVRILSLQKILYIQYFNDINNVFLLNNFIVKTL